MSRVLIWNKVRPGSELDIFHPTDYAGLFQHVQTKWNGQSQNWGNRLWFQGIYSALDTGENTYDFLPDEIDFDRINAEYDFIILSMANIFNPLYSQPMKRYAELFSKIRIPVYVIACGAQADSYDDLDNLVNAIGSESAAFIRSVYHTGGEFALRGYFTQEFFHRLGFHSAVVTGCPSLYQCGREFTVSERREEQFFPVFNGSPEELSELLQKYPNSPFMDQCEFFPLLYDPQFLKKQNYRFELMFQKNYGAMSAKLLAEGRLMLIADMNEWHQYLKNGGFNYSFGNRIHGTIMALLSEIPATIDVIDSRTREMAEFFDIPHCQHEVAGPFTQKEFLNLYEQMDYTAFNRNFKRRFDEYERFFTERGIVSHVNQENRFLGVQGGMAYLDALQDRQEEFEAFSRKLHQDRHIIQFLNSMRNFKIAMSKGRS